jgi:hypothetical protein
MSLVPHPTFEGMRFPPLCDRHPLHSQPCPLCQVERDASAARFKTVLATAFPNGMASKPRDPARIPRMLEKLRLLWEHSTDLRLGQLVDNVKKLTGPRVLFGVEDDVMEKGLDAMLKKFGIPVPGASDVPTLDGGRAGGDAGVGDPA